MEKGEVECVRRARNEVIQPSYFTNEQTNFLSRMMTADSFYSTLLRNEKSTSKEKQNLFHVVKFLLLPFRRFGCLKTKTFGDL